MTEAKKRIKAEIISPEIFTERTRSENYKLSESCIDDALKQLGLGNPDDEAKKEAAAEIEEILRVYSSISKTERHKPRARNHEKYCDQLVKDLARLQNTLNQMDPTILFALRESGFKLAFPRLEPVIKGIKSAELEEKEVKYPRSFDDDEDFKAWKNSSEYTAWLKSIDHERSGIDTRKVFDQVPEYYLLDDMNATRFYLRRLASSATSLCEKFASISSLGAPKDDATKWVFRNLLKYFESNSSSGLKSNLDAQLEFISTILRDAKIDFSEDVFKRLQRELSEQD